MHSDNREWESVRWNQGVGVLAGGSETRITVQLCQQERGRGFMEMAERARHLGGSPKFNKRGKRRDMSCS